MCTTIREYQGTGALVYPGGDQVECAFAATQHADGDLDLVCTTAGPGMPVTWFADLGGRRAPDCFRGTTFDGSAVEITGPLLAVGRQLRSPGASEARFTLAGPASLHVGSRERVLVDGDEIRFTVANLTFKPIDLSEKVTRLELAEVAVQLKQLPDYEERRAVLSHGSAATCQIQIPASLGLDQAKQLASDVCDLCSLARGTLVEWTCYDVLSPGEERKYSVHHPAIVRPYAGGLPLIDPRVPLELKTFLETCLPAYARLRAEDDFRAVVHASCEVRGQTFLDARALVCVSLLEHVIGKDAVRHGGLTLLPEEMFCVAEKQLRKDVETAICRAFPEATDDQVDRMVGHVSGFNRTSPSARLKRMAGRLGIHFTGQEIRQFVNTRNKLVHELRFSTDDMWTEFAHLVWILDRLVLGLLNYGGPYIDVRTGSRTEATRILSPGPPA